MKKRIFSIFILAISIVVLKAQSQPAVMLANTQRSVSLNGYLWAYEDESGAMTINDLRDSNKAIQWRPMPSDYLQTGYKNDYYWVRLSVNTEGVLSDDWFWWLDATVVQEVKFYVFDGDKLLLSDTLGINYPFHQRKILTRYPAVSVRPKLGQKLTLYASFHNDVSSLKGFLRFTTKSEYHRVDLNESVYYVGFFTFLILGCVMSFALWLFWSERVYVYFGFYILCTLLMSAGYKGFSFMWLWPGSPYLAHLSRIIWTIGTIGFFIQFEKALLFENNAIQPRLNQWLNILTGILIALGIVGFFKLDFTLARILVRLANLTFVISMITVFAVLIRAHKQYKLTAIYFLIAFAPIILVGIGIIVHNNKIWINPLGKTEMPFVLAQIFEIMFLFIALFKRFQTIKAIQKRQIELELQAKQQLQDERERIGRELHDNVGARLAHLIGQIDNLEYRLERDKSEKSVDQSLVRLENVGENARGVMNILRETIWAVKEESISTELFAAKIRSYLQSNIDENITCDVKSDCTQGINMTPGQALNLFRIVQEASQNVFKHAEATRMVVDIFCENRFLNIKIKDNGKGFDPSVSEQLEGHYGLHNMKHRAAEIGCTMHIETVIGEGTMVHLRSELSE